MERTFLDMPDNQGYFGEYGGQLIPPELKAVMDDINTAYEQVRQTKAFQDELAELYAHYVGRPSPIFYAKRLSQRQGGARIVLKREDLNHTGAHKINHCLGEALLAKHMGKTKVLAETGAGQHGVALASACALVGIDCEIHRIARGAPSIWVGRLRPRGKAAPIGWRGKRRQPQAGFSRPACPAAGCIA